MTPKDKASHYGEGTYSRQNQRDAANIFAYMEADESHKKDKQVTRRKRQAVIEPDGQRRQKAMKSKGNAMVNHTHDASNMPRPVEVQPGNSIT